MFFHLPRMFSLLNAFLLALSVQDLKPQSSVGVNE